MTTYDKAYYEAHREQAAARQRRYYERFPERRLKTKRDHRERNRDRLNAEIRAYYNANPTKKRAIHLRNRYGLELDEYQRMLGAQAGACAICGEVRRLVVDHDHETERVRGLLCDRCNNGLGFLERVGFVDAASEYLLRHDAKVLAALE